MIKVDVRTQAAARSFRALSAELPGVAARMLTEFARVADPAIQRAIPRVFDRPTPFTVNRVDWQKATRTELRSVVGIPKSAAAGGKSVSEYMRPGALGAANRSQRRTEHLLSRRGFLPAGWKMVPGSHLRKKLDGYGNVPGSYYKQVIRSLQIRSAGDKYFKGISKASQRRASRLGVDREFFAVGEGANRLNKGGGWLPGGVYRRAGRRGELLEQYFKFIPRAKYEQRLDMPKVARAAAVEKAPAIWQSVMRDVGERFLAKTARGVR